MYDVVAPTMEELRQIAARYQLRLGNEELRALAPAINKAVDAYRRLASLSEPKPGVKYPRTPGFRPSPHENIWNAWYWKCSIDGADDGILRERTVALKDNICVAGVPMMNGSAVLEGFVPDFDATVVTRVLDAGGRILGKAVAENLCCSAASVTAATGPIVNPRNLGFTVGGSSSGCAALLAAGECDMAIGTDQGGSIRIPSSLSGLYGLKPTYGLVPYTGIFPLENSLDHCGPMATGTKDLALLLEVVAGADPLDPRQRCDVEAVPYSQLLSENVKGIRFGILKEGLGWEPGSSFTDQVVASRAHEFERLGGSVREISVPEHVYAPDLYSAVLIEGAFVQMIRGNGFGMNWKGFYPSGAMDFFGKSSKTMADSFPDTVKRLILLGDYMNDRYNGRMYAKAQNQIRSLRKAYDQAFNDVDVLLMPTVAPEGKAMALTDDLTVEDVFRLGSRHHWNTCAFNLTGHPSMSVPCGTVEGLPVGMMLTGRYFEDATVLRAGAAFESLGY